MTALPNGIYKRRDSYYVRWKQDGTWKHKSAGSDLGAALELQAELLEGEPAPGSVGLPELVERYIKRSEIYGKRTTVKGNRTIARTFFRFFRNRAVQSLSATDLEAYIQHRLEKVSPRTVNHELGVLKAVLRLAVEEEVVAKPPFKIRMLKITKRRTAKIFTREEVHRLFDCADPRTRMLLLIACATGMRIGEIRHLQWQDIDSAQRKISVRAKEDWTPKTHQERECYVSQEVVDELERYRTTLKDNSPSDWVFQNKKNPEKCWHDDGSSFAPIRDTFKRAGLYQKGKLTHEIRRAVASTMLLNGTPIHVVKEILGHSTIKTTELYAFTTEEAKREASKNALV